MGWQVAGVDQASIVFVVPSGAGGDLQVVTFVPNAEPPVPGSPVTLYTATARFDNMLIHGQLFCVTARDDNILVGVSVPAGTTWKFFKSVTGASASWTAQAPWAGLTLGRAALVSDGTQFWLLSTATYSGVTTAGSAMSSRILLPELGQNLGQARALAAASAACADVHSAACSRNLLC